MKTYYKTVIFWSFRNFKKGEVPNYEYGQDYYPFIYEEFFSLF